MPLNCISSRSLCVFLAILILCLLESPAIGQQTIRKLLTSGGLGVGDNIPVVGGGTFHAGGIEEARVNNCGNWAAIVDNGPLTALVHNGTVIIKTNDSVVGGTVGSIVWCSLNNHDDLAFAIAYTSGTRGLFVNYLGPSTVPWIQGGVTQINDPMSIWPPTSTFVGSLSPEINDAGQVLVVPNIQLSSTQERAVIVLTMPLSTLQVDVRAHQNQQVGTGVFDTIAIFSNAPQHRDLTDNGGVVFVADLKNGPMGVGGVASVILSNAGGDTVVSQVGDTAQFLPGPTVWTWSDLTMSAVGISSTGLTTNLLTMTGSVDPGSLKVIARFEPTSMFTNVILESDPSGSPSNIISGHTVVPSLIPTAPDDLGESLWHGTFSGGSALFVDGGSPPSAILVQSGDTTTDGFTISNIPSSGVTIPYICDSGNYVIFPATAGGSLRLLLLERPRSGVVYCAGDGTGTACPCGNSSAIGDGSGCTNSLGFGSILRIVGSPSLVNDTVGLVGCRMPNSSALYFQGTSEVASGAGAVFGDGLRCAGGSVIRLKTATNVFGASVFPDSGDPSLSVKGAVSAPGIRTYQVWYRNSAAFCTSSTFNLTNGVELVWVP